MPVDAEYYFNRAFSLKASGQSDEAIASYRKAIELKPAYPEAFNNIGNIFRQNGELDKAIPEYQQAISIYPNYADAHLNLAWALLLGGDFDRGWAEFEWRWKTDQFLPIARIDTFARWDGQPLVDRTLMIHAEQGLGDTLQFVRYLPMIANRVKKMFLVCQPELCRLLAGCFDGLHVISGGRAPAFDVFVPLLSLPKMFGTTLENIPAAIPYLHAEAALVSNWNLRFGDRDGSARVGLAWAGNPKFMADQFRSPRELVLFSSLARFDQARFFSLQKGEAAKQTTGPAGGSWLTDWTAELNDFADTAALMSNLDLVITSDTSVEHLAGAMGKLVWIVLPFAPDRRWLLHRDDSPWYPSARLFRQSRIGDWQSVIAQVADALEYWLTSRDKAT